MQTRPFIIRGIVLGILAVSLVTPAHAAFMSFNTTNVPDGCFGVHSVNPSWAPMRNYPVASFFTALDSMKTRSSYGKNTFDGLPCGVYIFDTSGIPDNAIITSANLSLDYPTNKMTTPGDDGITVVNGNVNGILNNAGFMRGECTPVSDYINVSAVPIGYTNVSLNARAIENISKTGQTGFGTRLRAQRSNTVPCRVSNSTSRVNFYPAAGMTVQPYLYVEYTLPVSASGAYYDLYAYGDSITASSANYLVQYQSLFEPTKTLSYNTDGSGMNSTWGLENVRNNFHNNATDIYVMFGVNDMNTINATRVGINTDGICDAVEENGSVCHIMIHTMMANDTLWGGHSLYEIQAENITYEESYFDSLGRPYVKLYDAIDSVPCNDYPDPVNMSYMDNKAHPSITGQESMARYLYNRTDYCRIYWPDKVLPLQTSPPVSRPVPPR